MSSNLLMVDLYVFEGGLINIIYHDKSGVIFEKTERLKYVCFNKVGPTVPLPLVQTKW